MHRCLHRILFATKIILITAVVTVLNFLLSPKASLQRSDKYDHAQFETNGTNLEIGRQILAKNQTDRVMEQLQFMPKSIKSRDLVIYLAGKNDWLDLEEGNSVFLEEQCPVPNCRLVVDEHSRQHADAVIFKVNSIQTLINPSAKILKPPGQIWIAHSLESPSYSTLGLGHLSRYRKYIDWTASYASDADLMTPYGKYVPEAIKKGREKIVKNLPNLHNVPNFAAGKTKLVAWFVSHCQSKNSRELYVQRLTKYINIDVYGRCGALQCHKSDDCGSMLSRDYKFYLAFENSNCKEYITEKFFYNGLRNNIIPIVLGAPKEDYVKVAPPHSFIHVDDFATPQDLANYLHELDHDDTKYNAYFAWKNSWKSVDTKFWCRLCAYLNEPEALIKTTAKRTLFASEKSCDNNKYMSVCHG